MRRRKLVESDDETIENDTIENNIIVTQFHLSQYQKLGPPPSKQKKTRFAKRYSNCKYKQNSKKNLNI